MPLLKISRRGFAGLMGVAMAPGFARAADTKATDTKLAQAIASPLRTPGNITRDRYRHPLQMLEFFGLRDDLSVLEIEPGAGYWSEILAPYLYVHGRYGVAIPVPNGPESLRDWQHFTAKLQANPAVYGLVSITGLGATPIAPPNSVDLVLSCRNLHDWMADGSVAAKFASIRAALKPGGILGIEDHRGQPGIPQDPLAKSGYVREDDAKALIEHAGFRFLAASPVGDNPRDTKNYPKGVWSLPPVLAMRAVNRDKYLAIGESDRWTMKFIKA